MMGLTILERLRKRLPCPILGLVFPQCQSLMQWSPSCAAKDLREQVSLRVATPCHGRQHIGSSPLTALFLGPASDHQKMEPAIREVLTKAKQMSNNPFICFCRHCHRSFKGKQVLLQHIRDSSRHQKCVAMLTICAC